MTQRLIAPTGDPDTILFHFPGDTAGGIFFDIPLPVLEEKATPENIADLQNQFVSVDRFLKRYARLLKWVRRYDRVFDHRVNLQMEVLIYSIYLEELKPHDRNQPKP